MKHDRTVTLPSSIKTTVSKDKIRGAVRTVARDAKTGRYSEKGSVKSRATKSSDRSR
jgi:hypothetical protein